jgi:hypothetical protein
MFAPSWALVLRGVLAATIDCNLYESAGRREHIAIASS